MAKSNGSTGRTTRAAGRNGAEPRGATKPVLRRRRTATSQAAAIDADDETPPASIAGTAGARKAKSSAAPARRKVAKMPKAVAGAVGAALDKKAEDVVVLDLRKASGFTDYFVICTGANPRQITAIADGVRETLKRDFSERPALAEGVDRSEWILLDYFNFVVHVFSRDCRAFYGLERLWGNAERIAFDAQGNSR
jgi:ribosome-associated protein